MFHNTRASAISCVAGIWTHFSLVLLQYYSNYTTTISTHCDCYYFRYCHNERLNIRLKRLQCHVFRVTSKCMEYYFDIPPLLETILLFISWLVNKFNFQPAFNCTIWQLQLYHQWYVYHSLRKAGLNHVSLQGLPWPAASTSRPAAAAAVLNWVKPEIEMAIHTSLRQNKRSAKRL